MSGYYVGIDQGTTLTTAIITDDSCHVLAKASEAHTNYFPHPGWVEQDPEEIFNNCLKSVEDAVKKVPGADCSRILGIGLDHQGESCLVWEADTGRPIYPMIVWQDRRTSAQADMLEEKYGPLILEKTGVKPDAYYSATKLAWILDNVDGAREKYDRGDLRLGTFNTWFYWKLTGGELYVTDPGSGACMMLMDADGYDWNDDLLSIFGLKREYMPEIKNSIEIYGYTKESCFLGAKTVIGGAMEDSCAGTIGSGSVGEGILKTSYGTGSFMSLQTGEILIPSGTELFSNCMWHKDGKPWYRLRASNYSSGSSIEWLQNGLHIISDPAECEEKALSVPDSGDVYYVPALAGLATPFWDQYARGLLIGMTRGTTDAHIVRAVLEALAYQVAYCYDVMTDAYGKKSSHMVADGGPAVNGFLMQLQSDMLGIPVLVPEEKEAAAFGSACIPALAAGALVSFDDISKAIKIKKEYEPHMSTDEREARLARWIKAAKRAQAWAQETDA